MPSEKSDVLPAWLVLRYAIERMVWEEIGCANAATAGEAFRTVVLGPINADGPPPRQGEYRIVTLADSAHIAIEWNLRDLDAKDPVA